MMGEARTAHKWGNAAARKPLILSMILSEKSATFQDHALAQKKSRAREGPAQFGRSRDRPSPSRGNKLTVGYETDATTSAASIRHMATAPGSRHLASRMPAMPGRLTRDPAKQRYPSSSSSAA